MSATTSPQSTTYTPRIAANPSNTRVTVLRVVTTVLLVSALVMLVIYAVNAFRWRSYTYPGFAVSYTGVVDGSSTLGDVPWAGLAAGIQRLDRIVEVDGTALPQGNYAETRVALTEAFDLFDYGDTVTVTFERLESRLDEHPEGCEGATITDGIARCSVSYTLAPYPGTDFFTTFVFPFITSLIAIGAASVLLLLRPNNPNALLITLFCISLAVFSGGTFNNSSTHVLMPVWLSYTALGAVVSFTMTMTFPNRVMITYRQPVLLAVPAVLGGMLIAFDLRMFFTTSDPYRFAPVWQLPVYTAVISFFTLLVALLVRRRYTLSSIQRDQINTSLIGIALATIPALLWVISTIALSIDSRFVLPFTSATIMPFFITIPISMSYAVLQYRGLNTDEVLSRGITYWLMLGALVAGYFFLVLGTKLLTNEFIDPDNPFLIGAIIFFISVAFLPFRTWLQRQIDTIYFKTRKDYQTQVELFSREVSTTRSFNDILKLYVEQVQTALSTRGLFVFLPDDATGDFLASPFSRPQTDVAFAKDSDFVRFLNRSNGPERIYRQKKWDPALATERNRLQMLHATLIVPLRAGKSQINGFVILGEAQSGRQEYLYEEVRYLENISSQMAISVERAQVVESLERRVRELGVLSQVSEAVNFAVEFDDLLELVSAQTQKVLEAPHFYIALRDLTAGQMYYAFFMEYNERLRERENLRWNAGGDIYAHIIATSKPELHDDYSVTVANRGYQARALDGDATAWMGVPLVAGQDTLGVMAVATSRADFTYSNEQLKLFNDIGSLAATSLDKARLFEQTNQRARQLRALNDISRRLQSERDLDRLLTLITSSAADILNAEAGSLLLTAEDESGDLEFKVVIGGSGEELLGTRVPSGFGVAGQVAESGQSVIVNNTRQDDRWQRELKEDSEFNTRALLAVPLMADNKVIGVLEVINKRDGGLYVQEDTDVLETFAGQAAIAIENTRLYQQTDEQLKARLDELEALEKIDAELNRALNLERVAEITVKWAIVNTSAVTGLLGLVEDTTPPMLNVLHKYGYQEGEEPEGVDPDTPNLWPLDRGIVSRVLRTKQADLQTDVGIDPDYVPSMRGATSQITVPIMAGNDVIALLILERNGKEKLSLIDQLFVQRLTEHAAIAIENARLYTELSQTNESQSHYMGVGAHELKNALTPIKSYTEVLLMGLQGAVSDPQKGSLEVIKRNVSRAELIIQDLRDFAKLKANQLDVKPEPISIRAVAIETLRQFLNAIEEKEQELVNNIGEGLPMIYADSLRMVQVMTNFISNANKYSPEGATITLNAVVRRDQKDKNGRAVQDYMEISIADTGMGISESDQKKMFQPYFRTNSAKESDIPGTGLGMSLTKAIIEQHGGTVWLDSEINVGTTFTFTIPLAPTDVAEEATGD
jgi:signal transduction histidine kinase